ncbi:MAG: hypothetical protein ACFB0B_08915 [Thermonemataceae bacterium]
MVQNTAHNAPVENNTNATSKILSLMLTNFFVWLIPGVVIFALSLVILLILMLGAAIVDAKLNFQKWPKGLVSFLGISYFLAGITFLVVVFISAFDSQELIFLVGAAFIAWILAYLMLKAEWQRLSEKVKKLDV